jgi:hypothetical protein
VIEKSNSSQAKFMTAAEKLQAPTSKLQRSAKQQPPILCAAV